jgi:MerR family transcriptional regulator, light-induced transcriptional regulator
MRNHETGPGGPGAERAVHPIGVVSARTGLSADVIRVWERRYGVVEPARDEAGRRVYTDRDVERLRLLALATSEGRGIGQLAELSDQELASLVRSDEAARWAARAASTAGVPGDGGVESAVVEEALERTRALDGPGLEAALRRAGTLLGLSAFLERVVSPLFRRIGEEWHEGRLSVAQEHLATGVAGSLVARLAAAAGNPADAPLVVVATPSGEQHEIGALLVAGEAAAQGWRVAYLGPSVPADDIVGAAMETGARCVALSVVYGPNGRSHAEVAAVRAGLPSGVDLVVGGEGSRGMDAAAGVRWLEDLPSLRGYLADAGRRRS